MMQWTVKFTVPDDAVNYVLETADEHGITPWGYFLPTAACKKSARTSITEMLAYERIPLLVCNCMDGTAHTLTATALRRGLSLYAQKYGWPEDIGDIDAEAADLIIQYAVFGEVRYT